ncbi:hypothetical protein H8356DRAFT_1360290 [Neocallimastix lanati (nom. inval.)]|nr:hypothetical protein H8356DRAFT_1350577 [Neocallimastix sp. JGI-2020a]KAG4100925.1 hypothetical protein H8356DRAFT_1360290 [Neocallimastix sp. JGI-2020a]
MDNSKRNYKLISLRRRAYKGDPLMQREDRGFDPRQEQLLIKKKLANIKNGNNNIFISHGKNVKDAKLFYENQNFQNMFNVLFE